MVKQGRADKLAAAGIRTIEDLWKADLAKLAEHPLFQDDGGFLNQLPLLQGFAEAHAKGHALVYAADPRIYSFEEPVLHLDLEFDGGPCEIFLYGLLRHDRSEPEQWFDATRSGQDKLLKDFRDKVRDERPTIITWGGRTSDILQLRRACEKHGLRQDWIDNATWFDLQTDLVFTGNVESQRIYLPVKTFSSDIVATYFGYRKPRLKVRDGYHALHLYRAYKRNPRPELKRDLCEYNAEDIFHTQLILDGVRNLMRSHH